MIKSHLLENKFLRVKTLNIGASLFEVFDKKKRINLVLNLGNYKNYSSNKNYLGTTCGRFANRIKNARFAIKGKNYKLNKNEGNNILHGGKNAFHKKIWSTLQISSNSITYHYTSPHLEEGFPGEVKVSCSYTLDKNNLFINFFATTNQATHINLANHSYWNLDRKKINIFDHYLKIHSNKILQNDKFNIPNGKIKNVPQTPFNFMNLSKIGDNLKILKRGFDENYILSKNSDHVAELWSPKSNILLSMFSNQPGVQFYTGQYLKYKSAIKNLYPYQGLCLETQAFPNSPNNSKFPSTLLLPKKKYRHSIQIKIDHL